MTSTLWTSMTDDTVCLDRIQHFNIDTHLISITFILYFTILLSHFLFWKVSLLKLNISIVEKERESQHNITTKSRSNQHDLCCNRTNWGNPVSEHKLAPFLVVLFLYLYQKSILVWRNYNILCLKISDKLYFCFVTWPDHGQEGSHCWEQPNISFLMRFLTGELPKILLWFDVT